jgi:hypothetical protein
METFTYATPTPFGGIEGLLLGKHKNLGKLVKER